MNSILKVLFSAALLVTASELSKRSTVLGALLISLPLTSMLAIVWLYLDTGDVSRVERLAADIFWLVLPSLVFFLMLPALLRIGWGFWTAFGGSTAAMVVSYGAMTALLSSATKG